jgi:putative chitinase
MITIASLIAIGIPPTQARLFAGPLASACERFHIDTPLRAAGFIAQCQVESIGFTTLEENLYYSTPERIFRVFPSKVPNLGVATSIARQPQKLANLVYADRLGNGNEATGDGWRFRGRGLKMITGRYNYTEASKALGVSFVDNPDLAAEPIGACLTAAWFWNKHGLNTFADSAKWDDITRVVNGPAMLKKFERNLFVRNAIPVLTIA